MTKDNERLEFTVGLLQQGIKTLREDIQRLLNDESNSKIEEENAADRYKNTYALFVKREFGKRKFRRKLRQKRKRRSKRRQEK